MLELFFFVILFIHVISSFLSYIVVSLCVDAKNIHLCYNIKGYEYKTIFKYLIKI